MQPATSMNIRKVMDEEAKRERFASWYITLPEIPEYEKEMIEKSLKYNVWKELLTLFVVYHKIGRIPPFLVGGGMNATITIHRQM